MTALTHPSHASCSWPFSAYEYYKLWVQRQADQACQSCFTKLFPSGRWVGARAHWVNAVHPGGYCWGERAEATGDANGCVVLSSWILGTYVQRYVLAAIAEVKKGAAEPMDELWWFTVFKVHTKACPAEPMDGLWCFSVFKVHTKACPAEQTDEFWCFSEFKVHTKACPAEPMDGLWCFSVFKVHTKASRAEPMDGLWCFSVFKVHTKACPAEQMDGLWCFSVFKVHTEACPAEKMDGLWCFSVFKVHTKACPSSSKLYTMACPSSSKFKVHTKACLGGYIAEVRGETNAEQVLRCLMGSGLLVWSKLKIISTHASALFQCNCLHLLLCVLLYFWSNCGRRFLTMWKSPACVQLGNLNWETITRAVETTPHVD